MTMSLIQVLLFLVIPITLNSAEQNLSVFAGRVATFNEQASTLTLRVRFNNMKYLNKRDIVYVWNESNPNFKCKSYIAGKTNDYLLLKVPRFTKCTSQVNINTGNYIRLSSDDLKNNLKMGKELMDILLKKHLAIKARANMYKREATTYVEKVSSVNNRYQVLREKLEKEWRDEITLLEEDQVNTLEQFKTSQIDLNEVKMKIEQYRIDDDNLSTDRWSLDPKFYYKK